MTALTRDGVLALLRDIPEPCALLLGRDLDIVAMGLVEEVAVHDRDVAVTLVLTDTSCVHFTGMRDYIRDVLMGHGADTVDVRISTTTLWTPDRREHASEHRSVVAPPSAPRPGLTRRRSSLRSPPC